MKTNDGREEGKVEVDKAVDRKSHAVEMLEKEYQAKVITFQNAEEKGYGEFIKWLKGITRYGNIERTMLVFDYEDRISVKFFTSEHRYSISARLPENDRGYLGCTSSCRTPKVGETWTRGSDLADGKYSEKTFVEIMADIVSYEMKNLQCFQFNYKTTEEVTK